MITVKKILVPTDFSECSEAAVRYGLELARALDAKLHLLHVVQDPYTQPWAAEAFPAAIGDLLAEWQQESEKRLAESVPASDRDRVTISCVIASPCAEILRVARAERIDLRDGDAWPRRDRAYAARQRGGEGRAPRALPGADGAPPAAAGRRGRDGKGRRYCIGSVTVTTVPPVEGESISSVPR
jgi:universal stress protein A